MGSILISSRNRMLPAVLIPAISLFAFFLTLKAGGRGFFAFDQAILFDGGYRILSGQVPYKDFIIPVGPAAFWIQALFFRLLGVNYSSYIFTSAFINTLAALCGIVMIRMLFPSRALLSYAGGIVTAIWFLPPFGTLWVEQASFFFSFLAISSLLFTQLYGEKHPALNRLLLPLSGSLALLSILSKQNAGLYILPLYFLLIIASRAPDVRRIFYDCFIFSCGFTFGLALFIIWLLARSDWRIFTQYFIYIPSLLGIDRILEAKADLLSGGSKYAQLYSLPLGIRIILASVFITAVSALFISMRARKEGGRSIKGEMLAPIICLYAIVFQHLFIHTTMNQAENGMPFIGIILALGGGILARFAFPKTFKAAALSLAAAYLCFTGINVSLGRKVHGFSGSAFSSYSAPDKLRGLKWAVPTRAGKAEVKKSDITELFEYLKAKNENFFVFPNFTLFYGLLNVPSPQPVLWFHKGLTYPVIYDPLLDKWVVDDLRKNAVRVIVMEGEPAYNHYILKDFPLLGSYIADNFSRTTEVGIFNIYEKTDPRLL